MMKKGLLSSLCFSLLSFSCLVNKETKSNWQITYRHVEYFFGGELLQIGTDSCYFESQSSIHKNPPILRWQASKKELNKLYHLIENYELQKGSPLIATVTEEPFENLELLQNGKVIFSITKHQQTEAFVKKFDELVSKLKSFALK